MFELITGAIGLGLSIFGASQASSAAERQAQAQAAALQQQQAAEAARQKAAQLDAMRRRREIVRQAIQARSQSLAIATAQGGAQGSALQGAYGGISGRTNVNTLGVTQNLAIGQDIYKANQNATGYYREAALAGGDIAQAQGLMSIGGALMSNAQRIGQVGTFAAGKLGFSVPTV